ncbi:hypothetical protein EJB05_26550, partial [Eragrostis curvula]
MAGAGAATWAVLGAGPGFSKLPRSSSKAVTARNIALIIRHFAHPHPLVISQYGSKVGHHCDICGLKLAGLVYRCSECDFDVDDVCTEYTLAPILHPLDQLSEALENQYATASVCVRRWWRSSIERSDRTFLGKIYQLDFI